MKKVCLLLLVMMICLPVNLFAADTNNLAAQNVEVNSFELAHPIEYAVDKSDETAWVSSLVPETQYRYLRIVKNAKASNNILEVYDVKVYATSKSSTELQDICIKKSAEGVKSWKNISPSRGNDGNPESSWFNGACGTSELYWSVDLGEDYMDYNIHAVEFLLGEGYRNNYYANVNLRVELSNNSDFSNPFVIYNNKTQIPIEGTQYIDMAKGTVTVDSTGISYNNIKEPAKLVVDLGVPTKINSIELLMSNQYAKGFEVRASKISPDIGYDVIASYIDEECIGKKIFDMGDKLYTVIEVTAINKNTVIGICDIKVNGTVWEGYVNIAEGRLNSYSEENASKITDGKIDTECNTLSVIDIDLGRRYTISRIDLITGKSQAINCNCEIYASNTPGFSDSDDIILLGKFSALTSNDIISVDLSEKKYRYIRISANKPVSIAELLIWSDTDEYTGNWSFDSKNKIISINAANYTNIDKNYMLIVLLYDNNGHVSNIKAFTSVVEKQTEKTIDADISSIYTGGKIRAVITDTVAKMNVCRDDFVWEE